MQLNIYLISHPIIKLLSSSSNYQNTSNYINEKKYLGLLLFYEMMRKNFFIQTLYIKQILNFKTIYLPDFHQNNYIITNLSDTYFIVSEIVGIIPNLEIINIDQFHQDYYAKHKIKEMLLSCKKIKKKIIIFNTTLIENYIIQIIEFLISEIKINIEEINITCLTCSNQVLNKISKKYSELNIYTTKIIL